MLFRKKKEKFIANVCNSTYEKKCLLLYIAFPFLPGVARNSHQNIWQVTEMARLLSERGYDVDAADYDLDRFDVPYKYDLVIDILPRDHAIYEEYMNEGCKRLAYITGSNPSFANEAEKKRIRECNKRRNCELIPRRQSLPVSKSIENYGAVLFIGNEYNLQTYRNEFQLKKCYFIPNTGYDIKINEGNRKNNAFLYLGGVGQVHKGLDLLLEVFGSGMKEEQLYICSPFKHEKDFVKAYKTELYHKPNIHPVGFVDVLGRKFRNIADKCTFLILPSCSEGQAGAVCTAMSYGLIPVCTPECGFDEDEVMLIKDASIEGLAETVRTCLEMDENKRKMLRDRSLQLVRDKYSRENFTKVFSGILDEVIR